MEEKEELIIKFYSIEGNKIEDLNVGSTIEIDEEKEFKTSEGFNKALKTIIQKDINALSNKLSKIVSEVTKHLVIATEGRNNVVLSNKIEDLDATVNDIEAAISDLIIQKDGIKIRVFSSNKKEKKNKIKKLEDAINYVSKCQNDIIAIKNEYDKLIKRNDALVGVEINEEEEKTTDPLERTINFYKAKEN